MTWIRHDCGAGSSDLWQDLGDAVRRHRQHAKGCYWDMCEGFGLHRRDGHMASVKDQVLEQWAGWDGKRGAWADAVRQRCQDEEGYLRGWDRQSKLLDKQERDRASARARQREVRANISQTSREGSPEVRAHTDGRTNERTNERTNLPPPDGGGRPAPAAARLPDDLATWLPPDYHPDALAAIRAAHEPRAVLANLRQLRDAPDLLGLAGPVTGLEAGQAIRSGAQLGYHPTAGSLKVGVEKARKHREPSAAPGQPDALDRALAWLDTEAP